MSSERKASAVLLGPLIHLLRERGHDPAPVFARFDLSIEATRDPEAKIDAVAATRLIEACERLLNDPSMAIEAARRVEYTTFGALGLALGAGGDLHGVLNRITRFHRLISDLVTTSLSENEQHLILRFQSDGPIIPPDQVLAFVMACIVRLLRIRLHGRYNPAAVVCPSTVSPGLRQAMTRYFRRPVSSGEHFALLFDKASSSDMLSASDPLLARMLETVLSQQLSASGPAPIVPRLSLWIEEKLPEGEPALADAARSVALSTRTLQRRLKAEQLTWKRLIENTRKTLVERHLRSPGMSITQMAFLLGFSDVSSFSRAFRKWYGMPPSRFRPQGRFTTAGK